MGTAFAMHAAAQASDLALGEHDLAAYAAMRDERKHPPHGASARRRRALRARTSSRPPPATWRSRYWRRTRRAPVRSPRWCGSMSRVQVVVSVAKGLEPASGKRMSEVYGRRSPAQTSSWWAARASRVSSPRPPTAAMWAETTSPWRRSRKPFDDQRYQLSYTDDMIGVELCSMMKNVAAIGLGVWTDSARAPASAIRTRRPRSSRGPPARS